MKNLKVAICVIMACILSVASVLGVNWFKQSVPTVAIAGEEPDSASESASTEPFDYDSLSSSLSAISGQNVSADMLKQISVDKLKALKEAVKDGTLTPKECHDATGYTLNSLIDIYGSKSSINMGNNGKDTFTLGFTGDINFTYSGYVMTHARNMPNQVLDCIDETFQNEMRAADIMLVNNEFPYSNRGSALVGKKYTFRSDPENVKYMTAMGVDIVSLANNHAYDYGYDAFVDTISTLNDANIPFVGAGMNSEEANAPVTFIQNGYKIAYLACSGVESPIQTPVATETSEGIMGSYDDGAAMTAAIKKAKETCDYVFVYPHWGYENTTALSNGQLQHSRAWIDAGADAIIGNHAHILQGMEYYNGKFIAYSMGNFWFNTRNQPTILLKLEIDNDGNITPIIVAGTQAGSETHYMESEASRISLYKKIMGWSPNRGVSIDDNGVISNPDA